MPTTPSATGSTTLGANLEHGASTTNAASTSANTGTQANTYTPEQQAAQKALLGQLQGFLTGTSTVPGYMTAPPAAFQNLETQLTNVVDPALAAQYGSGSPQIGRQNAIAETDLASKLYQNGVNNYLGAAGLLGNAAFNAVGQSTADTGQTAGTSTTNATDSNIAVTDQMFGKSLLASLLGLTA